MNALRLASAVTFALTFACSSQDGERATAVGESRDGQAALRDGSQDSREGQAAQTDAVFESHDGWAAPRDGAEASRDGQPAPTDGASADAWFDALPTCGTEGIGNGICFPNLQGAIDYSGRIVSIEAGEVCSNLATPLNGHAFTVAVPDGGTKRIELALGGVALPLAVGDDIEVLYDRPPVFQVLPTYRILRNGEVIVYTAQMIDLATPPPLTLERGTATCRYSETQWGCGVFTGHNLVATFGAETVELGWGQNGQVGPFHVYVGVVTKKQRAGSGHCDDLGIDGRFDVAVVRTGPVP